MIMFEEAIRRWEPYAVSLKKFHSNLLHLKLAGVSRQGYDIIDVTSEFSLMIWKENLKMSRFSQNGLSYNLLYGGIGFYTSKKFLSSSRESNLINLLNDAVRELSEFIPLFEEIKRLGYQFNEEIGVLQREVTSSLVFDIELKSVESGKRKEDIFSLIRPHAEQDQYGINWGVGLNSFYEDKSLIDRILYGEERLLEYSDSDRLEYISRMNPYMKEAYIRRNHEADDPMYELPSSRNPYVIPTNFSFSNLVK